MNWSSVFLKIDNQLTNNDLLMHMIPYALLFIVFIILLMIHSSFKKKYKELLSEQKKISRQIHQLQFVLLIFLLLTPIIAFLSIYVKTTIITFILIIFSLFVGFRMAKFLEIVHFLLKEKQPEFHFVSYVYWALTWPVRFLSIGFAFYLLGEELAIPEKYSTYLSHTSNLLFIFSWAFFLSVMIEALYDYLTCSERKDVTRLDVTASQGLTLSLKAILIVLVIVSILPIFSKESFSAIITGLGIGGAAIALASQDVLKNILGGFTIMLDKPFKIGERVQVNSADGVVEEIGFRSTRIRLLNGQLTTIPNQIMATMAINNVTQRPNLRRDIPLVLALNTPNDKIEELIKTLKSHFETRYPTLSAPETPPLIFFEDILDNGLLVKIIYRQANLAYNEYVRLSELINYDILAILESLNIKLSQPVRRITME